MFNMLASILPVPPSGTPSEIAQTGLTFFSTWIARIGGLVAFIGAIKFALSIKNDEAKEQLEAVLIMVSGFMIVSAIRNLSIFSIPNTGLISPETAANLEFLAILKFIGKWTRRVGALALFIGSLMFGFSVKDNNATGKVTSLKTISAGSMVMAVSVVLPTFAYM